MIRTYLKLAIRNLAKNKLYSSINIGGLAVGIAICLLLMLWVYDELSFDRFHIKADQIYKINANFDQNGNRMTWNTPGPIATFGKQQIGVIEDAVRISDDNGTILLTYKDKKFVEDAAKNSVAYVDPSFFRIFDFPLVKGNSEKPFPDNKSMIISESIAKKIFGDEQAIGEVLQIEKEDFIITGVIKDMPVNSSIQYDVLLPFDILIQQYKPNDYWKSLESDWGNYYLKTFVLLDPLASIQAVADKLSDIHHKNQKESGVQYSLQPIAELHLFGSDGREEGMQTVRIFMIVAIAVLLIACINYINLATALATKRAKEVGVRKTIGADRRKLIVQFLAESAIISIGALLIAVILIQLSIPVYNDLSGKNLQLNILNKNVFPLLIITLACTWLISGIYPALVLSSFQPIQAIRGRVTLSGGNSSFRKMLVVAQFVLSITIIIGTLVIGKQINFIRNKKLGYNKENIFAFGLLGEMFKNKETIKTELMKESSIRSVTLADQNILELSSTTGDTDWEGKPHGVGLMIHPMNIDQDFLSVLSMELIAGKSFTGAKSDSAAFILNRTAVKEMGLTDPIGKSFTLWQTKGTIIGVVKDFHHRSIHTKIEPTVFLSNPKWQWIVYIKTDGINNEKAVAAADKIWKQYNPAYPFDYKFLDVFYDSMYKNEQRIGKLFFVFSTITVIISSLGLFGLATFTATSRIKEIGIRKVMGASVNQIIILLSKDFIRLIIIAIIVAIPIAYIAMENWLENFAYHTPMEWTVFAFAGCLSFLIVLIIISLQSIKASLANPVDSLRNE